MLMQTLLTAAFSALALGVALAAEPASLSGDELRKAVSGKTVYVRISGFELPIHYFPGGSMAGGMGGVAATIAREESASDGVSPMRTRIPKLIAEINTIIADESPSLIYQ